MDNAEIEKRLVDQEARLRALERLQTRENNALKIDLSPQEIRNLSPRTQAERITAGIDEPQHIGIMSIEVLEQLIWSINNTKSSFIKKKQKEMLSKYEEELEEKRKRAR